MLHTTMYDFKPKRLMHGAIAAAFYLASAAVSAQYVGIYPLYDMYQGNSEQKECWNTFLVDTIGNTSQSFSDYAKLTIEMATLNKSGKVIAKQELQLTSVDGRYLVGMLINPKCSQSFAVTNVSARDNDGATVEVQVDVFQKNDLISKGIKLKDLVNK